MSLHSRPNGSTYFADNPSLTLAQIKTAIDTELNALASTVNSIDNANIDGTPAIALSKLDLSGADYLPVAGGDLDGILNFAFEGVWERFRASGNGRVRNYNASGAGVIWGVCYNTEYNAGWGGRDVTDVCWRLEMQSDGLHLYWAVSAASGVAPTWTETMHYGDYTAGDFSLYRHPNSAHNVTSLTAYTKELEVRVNRAGTYRVRFGLYNDFLGTCYGRVYKNGAPYGTARSHWTDGTTGWFSEDLTFAQGDLIQIFAYSDGSTNDQVRDLEIFVSAPDIGRTLNY